MATREQDPVDLERHVRLTESCLLWLLEVLADTAGTEEERSELYRHADLMERLVADLVLRARRRRERLSTKSPITPLDRL